MSEFQPIQIAKRIIEAEGYLELGMPHGALERIRCIDDAGQFGPAHAFLLEQATRQSEWEAGAAECGSVGSLVETECSPECEKALKACNALIQGSRGGNHKADGSGNRGR